MPDLPEDIALNLDNYIAPIDLSEIFSSPGPVHLEVGAGKGTFILNQAKAHPEINYLGIEWANKYYRYSVDRIRRWGIKNVRLLHADARDFIGRFLPDSSIEVLHVYFPDPWPKKRHQKRRFFQRDNIAQVNRVLKMGGQLRTATDHKEYFSVISELLRKDPVIAPLFSEIEFYPAESADPGEWVGSNFERKYLKEGRAIYTLALKKVKSGNFAPKVLLRIIRQSTG